MIFFTTMKTIDSYTRKNTCDPKGFTLSIAALFALASKTLLFDKNSRLRFFLHPKCEHSHQVIGPFFFPVFFFIKKNIQRNLRNKPYTHPDCYRGPYLLLSLHTTFFCKILSPHYDTLHKQHLLTQVELDTLSNPNLSQASFLFPKKSTDFFCFRENPHTLRL